MGSRGSLETLLTFSKSIGGRHQGDVTIRPRRLDIDLTLRESTEAVRFISIRVLVNILRFYRLATTYFGKIENSVADLDNDVMMENATGVAQLNSTVEQVQRNVKCLSVG